ncbi:hypothetical protein [Blastochloris sulfoviridis]|uniref:Uncharacterized protein n=1 Tax=Blastochloris sulfoviridis TaxID=50712 RepID=A0A5M6HMT6_9HYPH|nr:hypothetical protein [Blastochloris sulfoviridis]KAA5597166.1 hypothetical protein F1193_15085 [Blastochloris sulfoviridis]
MNPKLQAKLEGMCQALGEHISTAKDYNLQDIAMYLKMARLAIQMEMNMVSNDEMKQFCEALGECRNRPPARASH